jgi:hypothetical protein
MRLHLITSTLILIFFAQFSFAQETVFTTKVSSSKAGLQDAFQVTYEIKNAGSVSKFLQPNFAEFNILNGPNQSSNISMFNGDVSQTLSFTYIIQCKKLGIVNVPSAGAIVDGRTIKSNNASIEIVKGSVAKVQQKQPSRQRSNGNIIDDILNGNQDLDDVFNDPAFQQNPRQRNATIPQQNPTAVTSKEDLKKTIFIKVDVDKKVVQVGEQLTATYKLYTRTPMQMNLSKLPSLNGFWSQDFAIPNPPSPFREIVDGVEYQVFLLKKSALFPTQSGTLILDAAEAEGTARVVKKSVQQPSDNNLFDDGDASGMQRLINSFFRKGLGSDLFSNVEYEDVPVNIASEPLTVQVNDMPIANKPSSYNGAVGNFTLESNIDKTEITTDETSTITLTVRGNGNLKLIGAPSVNFPTDFQSYDPKIKDTITSNDNTIAGYKTFKYTCEPTIVGDFTVPSTEFSFYDPTTKSYKTLTSPSYVLHVKEGKNYATQNRLPKDIHDIQSGLALLEKKESANWMENPIYWSAFGFPLLVLLSLSIFKKQQIKQQSNTVKYKHKQANKIALKRLSNANNYLQQQVQKPFYEEISKALWLYLSDKLNIPISLLSKENIETHLTEKKVDDVTSVKLLSLLNECETALYSRNNTSIKMKETYEDSLALIGTLEEIL